MLSRPQSAPWSLGGCSRFRLFLFALCLILALLGYYLLLDFKHSNAAALTGELTLDGGAQTQVLQGNALLAFLFDYCGTFVYLLPVLGLYIAGSLILLRINIKEVNFFVLGLRLLGFNTLVLGGTALLSVLHHSGGILGDFLQLILSALLGANLTTLTAVGLSAAGLFLFIGRNPLQLCELIGAQCFFLIDKLRGSAPVARPSTEQTPRGDEQAAAAQSSAPLAGAAVFGVGRVTELPTGSRSEVSTGARAEPSFGETQPVAPNLGLGAAQNAAPQMATHGAEAKLNGRLARQEPDFGDSMSSHVAMQPTVAAVPEAAVHARTVEVRTAGADQDVSADAPAAAQVSTIITRGPATVQAAALFSAPPPAQGATPFTPQTEEATRAAQQPEDGVATIITKASDLQKAVSAPPQPSSDDASDDGETHTVITYHQAPAAASSGAASEPVAEVHTHIFTTPAAAAQLPENVQPQASAAAGRVSLPDDVRPRDSAHPALEQESELPLNNQYAPYEQPPAPVESYGPTEVKTVPNGGRILSFADIAKEEAQAAARTASFEVNALPPGISAQAADGLRDDKEHVSEKDLALRFPSASRGVLSQSASQNAPSVTGGQTAAAAGGEESHAPAATPASALDTAPLGDSSVPQRMPSMAVQGSNSNTSNLPTYLQNSDSGNPTVGVDNGETFSVPLKVDCIPSSISAPHHFYDSWRPGIELLTPSPQSEAIDQHIFDEMSQRINSFFADFKIKAQVVGHRDGPVITTYALELAPGVRFASIHNLVDDLCRILKVPPHSVRALSSLPGTIYAGLEVPSPKRRLISLHDVAQSTEFQQTKAELPICLGQNVEGNPVIVDLAAAPHLLIAGTTGSGKSAGLNSMLISLLLKRSPAELRLILIDPKRLEFALYNNLPHLITPVISDVAEKTGAALQWCVDEMERRYRLIEAFSVRKLSEYNDIIEKAQLNGDEVIDPAWSPEMGGTPPTLRKLPYIVVVIEEFADLMAQTNGRGKKSGDTPEMAIARLTAKSRACGIHIILATQTPRAEILTGTIRANMPSRVAFTVQSGMESRIILDETGAECLLGLGDMICKFNGYNRNATFRAHGAFVSNSDVLRIVENWQAHGEAEYVDGVTELPPTEDEDNSSDSEAAAPQRLDPLFDKVKEYALDYYARRQKNLPTSEIQSIFGVGYPRAKKIAYQLEREGVFDNY